MATKAELIKMMEPFEDDAVMVCMDSEGGWDNIEEVVQFGSTSGAIVFSGGSPFSDE